MKTPTRPYHHGHLRQALIDMAVTVAEETGKDLISVREVARRLGVSSGAPFRHFPDRASLMTAVAEEATLRLRIHVEGALSKAPAAPLPRLKLLGHAFIRWALRHPTQFRLVSSRRLFEFDSSPSLQLHFSSVRDTTLALVGQAVHQGELPPGCVNELALALRALAYGLARMQVDGQLPQWQVPAADAEQHLCRALDRIIDGLARPPDPARPPPARITASRPRP